MSLKTTTASVRTSPSRRELDVKGTAKIDPESRRLLRVLGEAALRLANGQSIDDQWLHGYLPHAVVEPTRDLQRPLLTVAEACELLRISRWSFYRLIQQNQLRSVMIGRRRFVPHVEISRFVTTLSGIGEHA
jgi:excisionase family DNA binding protein